MAHFIALNRKDGGFIYVNLDLVAALVPEERDMTRVEYLAPVGGTPRVEHVMRSPIANLTLPKLNG
jgi:hypothetical protein